MIQAVLIIVTGLGTVIASLPASVLLSGAVLVQAPLVILVIVKVVKTITYIT
jgi:hypothetical protein